MQYCLKLLCFLFVIGCAVEKKDFKDRNVDSIYKAAFSLMKAGEYTDAASEFKDIETLFPYSFKASEGQVLSAYCYFLASSYMDAIREIEVFIRYHPSHKLVAYAMYLKAMSIYMQVSSIGRDSQTAINAVQAFVELANKFPNSEYYKDCLNKIEILNDTIAAHEMVIGRYYQQNKSLLSAIGRYTFVVTHFPHSVHAREALYRVVECCDALGLREEAQNSYRVLVKEYPGSFWENKAKLLVK